MSTLRVANGVEERMGGAPRVVVDPGRQIGRLSRDVFGGFVEHLGRCINGGLFEEGSSVQMHAVFARTSWHS